MSCRISMARVQGERVVWRGPQEAYAAEALKAGVGKTRAGRAAGYPTCSGWFGRSFQSGGLSRHSEELRPVQESPLPSMTPSNGRIGKRFKNRPARKIEVNLSTCRHHSASSNIAVIDDGGASRKGVFPEGAGKGVSIF